MITTPTPGDRPEFAVMNGDIVPFSEARISIMAPGLTFAVTVFEGVRAYWNADEKQLFIFRLPEHLERLQFSMRMIELSPAPPSDRLSEAVAALIRANGYRADCYIRPQAYVDD